MAQRIKRERTKGWKAPEGAVYIGRPGPWGNPWSIEEHGRDQAVELFRQYLAGNARLMEQVRQQLAGRDLMCWCPLDEACHGDVLLQAANQQTTEDQK